MPDTVNLYLKLLEEIEASGLDTLEAIGVIEMVKIKLVEKSYEVENASG